MRVRQASAHAPIRYLHRLFRNPRFNAKALVKQLRCHNLVMFLVNKKYTIAATYLMGRVVLCFLSEHTRA